MLYLKPKIMRQVSAKTAYKLGLLVNRVSLIKGMCYVGTSDYIKDGAAQYTMRNEPAHIKTLLQEWTRL